MSPVSGPGAGQTSVVRRKGSKPGWGGNGPSGREGRRVRGEWGAPPPPAGAAAAFSPPDPFAALRVRSQPSHLTDTQQVLTVRIPAGAGVGPRVVASAAGFRCVCASGFCVLGHYLTKFKKMVQ